MIKSISRKTKHLLLAAFALFLSIAFLMIEMPKAKAMSQWEDHSVVEDFDILLAYRDFNKDKPRTQYGNFTLDTPANYMDYNFMGWQTSEKGYTVTITYFSSYITKINGIAFCFNISNGPKMNIYVYQGDTLKDWSTATDAQGKLERVNLDSNTDEPIKIVISTDGNPESSSAYQSMRMTGLALYEEEHGKPVYIAGGTGIKSAYLSTDSNATSGKTSGAGFDDGTVYGFITLREGYKADNGWTLISSTGDVEDAIYCVGTVTVDMFDSTDDYNIGKINAILKTMTLTPKGNGIDDLDDITLTYGQTATIPAPTEQRAGCTFEGWNTKADGTGDDYTTSLSIPNVNSLIMSNTTLLYAKWDYDQTIQDLIDEINDITVDYTSTCKTAINTAFTHYNSLSDEYKSSFPKTSYDLLVSKNNAYDAMDKINAIGTIANTPESKALVDAAKNFYDVLDSDTKALVLSNFVKTLTDDVAVMNAITKVNEIGTLDESDECWDKICEAISAYIVLNDDQKEMFPADTYKTFDDKHSAKLVIDKIKAIGDVEYSSESKGKIDNAQDEYDLLTNDQKELVINKDKLTQANTDYDAVDNVVGLINLIPSEFDYSDEYKEKLDAAKEAYYALTPYQKSIVPSDIFDKFDNGEKIYNVTDLINNIGKVEYTQSCKEKIDAARSAYDALTNEQKELVDNYQTLVNAEAAYDAMRLIDAIGEVKYTEYCKERIDSARARYNALTDAQKNAVTNYNDLVKAEDEFAKKASDAGTDSKPEAKYERENKENGVHIETKDETAIPEDINLKVEVKTSVKAKELIKEYNSIKKLLKSNSKISKIYDVKLIRTVNGVEEEIQPSDIKDGTNVTIKISMPENLKKFRLLHIHSEDDIEEIKDYVLNNNELEFDCNKLSEFVIVIPGGGIITDNHGFCVGWVVFIIAIVLLVYLALYIFIYFGICEGLIKKLRLDGLKNVSKLLGIINMAICGVVFVFALVSLILHTCPITIASFVLVTLAIAAFVTLFIMYLLKNNKVEEAIEQ